MKINPFVTPLPAPLQQDGEKKSGISGGFEFADLLTDALYKVNQEQLKSAEAAKGLVSGNIEDLHQVMLVSEKAKLSLHLSVQVTNKLIDAYREISRMQI